MVTARQISIICRWEIESLPKCGIDVVPREEVIQRPLSLDKRTPSPSKASAQGKVLLNPEVFKNREIGTERKFLVYNAHSKPARYRGRISRDIDWMAIVEKLARVRESDPGKNSRQGTLTCSIRAN
jgi:hypothetical protein